MGIATQPITPRPCVTSHNSKGHKYPSTIPQVSENLNSMSQDYHHHSLFSYPNGFERSQAEQQQHQQQQQQQHMAAQQIRRDKLRAQGFELPQPFEEETSGLPTVYETAGMLSEMFNFPPGTAATELLETQFNPNFRQPNPRPQQIHAAAMGNEWFGNRQGMVVGGGASSQQLGYAKNHTPNAAESMQLFLMNPQPRSPSPSPPNSTSSTLHMLLPNPSSTSTLQGFHNQAEGSFGQFMTWGSGGPTAATATHHLNTPNEIGGVNVVESQGLSLSLSSSLQHKAEELQMSGETGGMLFFNQGGSSTSGQYRYKNLNMGGSGVTPNIHQVHVGYGSSLGVVNVLRNSKYAKAAQELLEEFCSVGRGKLKKNNNKAAANNPNTNPSDGGANNETSSKDVPTLSAADRIEHQRRKVKLLSMLDEACILISLISRSYGSMANHCCLFILLIKQTKKSTELIFYK